MTTINYQNNQKLQVEFSKENFVEDSWMFLIQKFIEKLDCFAWEKVLLRWDLKVYIHLHSYF